MEQFSLERVFDAIDTATQSESGTAISAFGSFMSLPDEQFLALKDSVLTEFERGFNNSNDKLALMQSLNISNIRVEDMAAEFENIAEALTREVGEKYGAAKADFIIELLGILLNAIADSENVAKRVIQIPIELCADDVKIPQYAHIDDAGMDVYAPKDYSLGPGEQVIIPLDFKIAIPTGYAVLVQPRSGLSAKTKLRVANTPGLIDSGYRGNVGVILENIEPKIKDIEYDFDEKGHPIIKSILHGSSYNISKGDRIAQLRLVETPRINFYQVSSVEATDRGEGGYGSTGV